MAPRITLLTDFGTRDGYVAALKAVIASICPTAVIDDASHDIPAGDVAQAAFTLRRYWKLYPPGTIHVIVVDPGVGSERRALAASAEDRLLVGPDNGVLALALREAGSVSVVGLDNPRFQREVRSATFHGRDVFAPAAGHLACGVPLDQLGASVPDIVQLELAIPEVTARGVRGQVVYIDHFGNLITNIPATLLRAVQTVTVSGRVVALRETYGRAEIGQALALVNSDGLLEIAVRDGSAAAALKVARGAAVEITAEQRAGT